MMLKNLQLKALLTLFLLFSIISFSQEVDFNNYKNLKCVGPMPSDFKLTTQEKIDLLLAEDPTIAKDKDKLIFFEGVYRKIDEILQSGYVTYGDEITEYVKSVAEKVLQDDPKTFAKLRFYTVQSIETNALSTQQGIIFVTTGLISQLANEAQLAYVLAHEISHFTENHVLESYEWRKENRKNTNYKDLASYSKDHELEADRKAVDLYKKAGYSFDELVNTFDVLMYSYLPFDEIAVKKEFYNIPKIFFGDEKFATKDYPITAVEDYDDELSSHPNIKTRKEQTLKVAEEMDDWGTTVHHFGVDKFKQVRNIARFESLRIEQMNHNFGRALYLVFLLEKDFPNSEHVQEMKAFSWYGLGAYYNLGKKSNAVPRLKNSEGESAKMFHFLHELKRDELNALALRNIYEVYTKNPENKFILKIVKEFANGNDSRWAKQIGDLKPISYDEALKKQQITKDSLAAIKPVETTEVKSETGSKYDRIKTKKTIQASVIDSTTCYRYGFADILSDTTFLAYFPKKVDAKASDLEEEEENNDLDVITDFLIEAINKDEKSISDLGKIIIIDPTVSIDLMSRDKSKKVLDKVVQYSEEALKNEADAAGVPISLITTKEIQEDGNTDHFNDRNLMTGFLEQQNVSESVDILPVDYTSITEFKERKGVDNVCFSLIDFTKGSTKISGLTYFTCIFLVIPAIPIIPYMIYDLSTRNETEYSFIAMDLESGETIFVDFVQDNAKPTKLNIGNYYHHLFK